MEKVIRDGKVAVLISAGFGAGWYTWNNDHKELMFHPKIVEMVEKKNHGDIDDEWCLKELGLEHICCLGCSDLEIHWIPVGDTFYIKEYDGSESIVTGEELIVA